MIHRIYSSDSRFKELRFRPGLNVLVTDKTNHARKDQTRNAAGKSSVLEIIHYALGSKGDKDSFFAKDVFAGTTFGLVFDLRGQVIQVERAAGPDTPRGQLKLVGKLPGFVESGLADNSAGAEQIIKLRDWTTLLGKEVFGVPDGDKFTPSFRMAFPYFCRVDSDGGMQAPFESWKKQPAWQRDVTLAFLLGLGWDTLSKMEILRVEETRLDQLKKELSGSGVVGQIIGTTARLRANLAVDEQRIRDLEQQLKDFQVLPEYKEIEVEASRIARNLAELTDYNTADRRLIADLKESLSAEQEPDATELERLYAAAGVQLPGVTLARLDSVKEFHRTVIRNRKTHLTGEITAAERRIAERDAEAVKLSIRQRELMGLLQAHGALDQFNKLQEELGRLRSTRDLLQKQSELARKIETGGADMELQRAMLHQALIHDMDERAERLNEAVLLYAELSKAVSERSSILEIEATNKGLKMAITGGPSKSKGIREQQIFCFDMLLAVMQSKRPHSLGFVVHDSHLFDAMDERQVANAIEVGARLSKQHGFQYIITTNSDRIPYNDFSEGFDFDSHVIEPRLTDETETGGLFGFRFA